MSTKTLEAGKETISLARLGKSSQDLVRFAIYCGWTGHNTPAGGVLLASTYVPGQTINVPAQSNLQDNRRKGWTRKVLRYADPVRRAVAEAHFEGIRNGNDKIEHDQAALATSADDNIPTSIVNIPAPPAKAEPLAELKPERTILSERPWMAKLSTSDKQGRTYESHAVIERVWSDGKIDYRCSMSWCDYDNAEAVRVARHYGRAKGHPTREERPVPMASEPYVPNHRDNSSRIARLARELAAAAEAVGTTSSKEEWIQLIAEKMIERRDARGAREDHDGEPLTAEQVLERIRGLVDDGSYLRRLERERELEDELNLLRVEAAEAHKRATTAEERCLRITEEWDTLRELIAARGES